MSGKQLQVIDPDNSPHGAARDQGVSCALGPACPGTHGKQKKKE